MSCRYNNVVNKWGVFEVACDGYTAGNPFTDYSIRGVFTGDNERVTAEGFYDGEGIYRVRFMPSFEGRYTFRIEGSFSSEACEGAFETIPAEENNHGPVRVADTYHFVYEDAAPYYPIGTTCYVWNLQSDELINETLESLKESGFNKIRFCIFPKHYDFNLREPRSYPYEGTPVDSSGLTSENFGQYTFKTEGNHWDFSRFNPAHFRHIEKCIAELGKLGVEADIIVMHPYDRWGFSMMTREQDRLYWHYVVARFAAFRNVWWSLANEWDLMPAKEITDWEMYADILCRYDPYHHLRSIHNCVRLYDHTRPWVTHVSFQRTDLYKGAECTDELRVRYGKPVVLDEIAYEGNIQHGWGNISGQELIRRFWEGALRGGYPGHGETFLSDDNILWWSHGGRLKGESWKRVKFLMNVLNETPGTGLKRGNQRGDWDTTVAVPENGRLAEATGYRIYYYGFMRPSFREFCFGNENEYSVEVIDTWNMTITPQGSFRGKFRIDLPAREYMAIRIRKADIG